MDLVFHGNVACLVSLRIETLQRFRRLSRPVTANGLQPNGTHLEAEPRKVTGEESQITWEFNIWLAPLCDKAKIGQTH